jgi:hypothetical protein
MGQDREFTKEDKDFALNSIKDYKNRWEILENQSLLADVQRYIKSNDKDKETIDPDQAKNMEEEETKFMDEWMTAHPEANDEESKEKELRKAKFEFMRK